MPDGLAIKMYPCCYALQRPISAIAELARAEALDPDDVSRIEVRTPEATVVPLIRHHPGTGLQGKFSLEYAIAAALLDRNPGFASFTDAAVRRPAAGRLVGLVETELEPGGDGLLDGQLQLQLRNRVLVISSVKALQAVVTDRGILTTGPARRCHGNRLGSRRRIG